MIDCDKIKFVSEEDRVIEISEEESPKLTPQEQEIRKVATEVHKKTLYNLQQAATLADFLRWHAAAAYKTDPDSIRWMWKLSDSPPTTEEIISDFDEPSQIADYEQDARIVQELMQKLAVLPDDDGQVNVVIHRDVVPGSLDEAEAYFYYVLASFPKGTKTRDSVLTSTGDYQQKSRREIIFFRPETGCLRAACSDLLRQKGDNFSIPFTSLKDSIKGVAVNNSGRADYILGMSDEGSIEKQPTEAFLLAGLNGEFSNERIHVRISDFLNKPTQKF